MEKACRGGVICEHTGSAGFFCYDINRMILLAVNSEICIKTEGQTCSIRRIAGNTIDKFFQKNHNIITLIKLLIKVTMKDK